MNKPFSERRLIHGGGFQYLSCFGFPPTTCHKRNQQERISKNQKRARERERARAQIPSDIHF